MIHKDSIKNIVEKFIAESSIFIVSIEVSTSNHVRIFVDTPKGISIEECAKISRTVEAELELTTENFELEVSSPGIDSPLLIPEQYTKNIGNEVSVLKNDGIKTDGKLISFDESGIIVETKTKVLVEGKKKKQLETKLISISYAEMKYAKPKFKF